jgi:GNAT superfamily N-acetyltransferase
VTLFGRDRELPEGYPGEYEKRVRLGNGRRVQVRPILPSDAPELAEAIRTADAETLRGRFLGGAPPVTDELLDFLTRVDYTSHFALVARYRRRGIAIARYIALPPDEDGSVTAEIAVAVDPGWRRVGLATALVRLLARRAQECGISAFHALFFSANRPVVELAHDLHARVFVVGHDSHLEINLTGLDVSEDGVPAT